ncbi:MAG: TIGR04283 family arsenosugar biosynthesis glycosyltransferase [Pirellulales bacterium]|nr:TIGR04283 family arsenosugar biosynthesis glycosyltransferase [Pirellulales bacterium]
MYREARVALLMPALNEEQAIGEVLCDLPDWIDRVVVADNGSTDKTAEIAKSLGAEVVYEPRRGYGAACLGGLNALCLGATPEIVVFMDADRSDAPEDLPALLNPLVDDNADLVIGSRVLGDCEPGALSMPQRFGNALASSLLRKIWGVPCTDLGPFRAIRLEVLKSLEMSDLDFGWTVEMQARAARRGLRIVETPVAYRRRVGRSKISGTIRGVIGAGTKILGTIGHEWLVSHRERNHRRRMLVFSRWPTPGTTKTRMIPALGAQGAADLQAEMTARTLQTAKSAVDYPSDLDVRFTGGTRQQMSERFGRSHQYREQGTGDLGDRLKRAFTTAFEEDCRRVVCVGSDCPGLTTEILESAWRKLLSHDVVLGPAKDGGYYLIGLREPILGLFQDIDWGTSRVLQQTRDRIRSNGLSLSELPPLSDVDQPDDLVVWKTIKSKNSIADRDLLSVIIPTLNAEATLQAAIQSAQQGSTVEIIVSDGGSSDGTLDIAQRHGVRVISTRQGRARQMNAGAEIARGEIFLFLHADTRLPFGYRNFVDRTLRSAENVAGAFRMAFDSNAVGLRTIELGTSLRSRLLQLPYGDQAIFLRREIFQRIGGFPDLDVMEDYAFVNKLRMLGKIAVAQLAALTSDRKYRQHGLARTVLKHQKLILDWQTSTGNTTPP